MARYCVIQNSIDGQYVRYTYIDPNRQKAYQGAYYRAKRHNDLIHGAGGLHTPYYVRRFDTAEEFTAWRDLVKPVYGNPAPVSSSRA